MNMFENQSAMKKKTVGMTLAVWGVVLVVYHLLVFLILKPVTGVFWLSYGFMLLAFVLQLVGLYFSFKQMTVKAVFFGIPLASFTLYFFFAELFMSTVFMIFQSVPLVLPFLLQALLLAVYAVVAIVSVLSRDAAVGALDQVQSSAAAMRLNTVDIETLRDAATDPELKNQLRRLAEAVRYSDPMSNPAIADVEAAIKQETFALQTYCDDGDIESAKSACARLNRLYVERNRKLAVLK